MAVLCPSCHVEPLGASAGAACPECGTKMIAFSEPVDDLIGKVVDGRFEIVGKLGEGGMGTVYRAKQTSIGREVALKVMDRELQLDAASVKRFFREAQLASQLSHPNTVSVIEFGQHTDGRLYLVMELVRGRTLHDIVRDEGALPVSRVVKIGLQMCDALEAAHKLGIIHRDLKLENVMILERDLVKILDFGLARSVVDPNSRATRTGVIAGTPRYLPPEVATGGAEPASPQDLYSLGVILGEIAVGHELWRAATIEGLLALKLDVKPKLDGCHPELRALVERLLAIEPAARPDTAETRVALLAVEEVRPRPTEIPDVPAPPPALAPTLHPKDIPSYVASKDLVEIGVAVHETKVDPPPVTRSQIEAAKPLEIETEWQEEKAAKAAAARWVEPKRSRSPVPILAAILFVVGGSAVAWYVTTRHHLTKPPALQMQQPGLDGGMVNTVTISIEGDADAILVDGAKAGRPPLTLHMPRAHKTIVITARFGSAQVTREVQVDRDQVVQIDAP